MRYNNNAISRDDPQALEKLTEKLTKCQETQDYMKTVNSYFRKNGTAKDCPGVSDEQAAQYDDRVKSGNSWQKAPFPQYALTNNNAEINRLKKRIAEISTDKELGFVGWEFNGGEAVINEDINRLQLVFDEKPSDEQRAVLKSNGFKWAPSEGAWQRQLNGHAMYAANRIDFIKPENGQRPTDLQPKAPKKDEPER